MLSCYMVGDGSARAEVVQTDMNSMSPNGKTRSRGEGLRLARILEPICELVVGREGHTQTGQVTPPILQFILQGRHKRLAAIHRDVAPV